AAVYVPPTDSEALAVCVNSLIARRATRDELGRKARARALSFTTDRMATAYLAVYTQARARYRSAQEVGSTCVS
ncbi:MAG TPA: hypothetical protein VER03_06920, partial [Bryobacteraceae bacterium]|nr:hypothetical protein [Bryobacteraceae bacterium]